MGPHPRHIARFGAATLCLAALCSPELARAQSKSAAPVVERVEIEGLVRTDPRVVSDYLGVEPGDLFTAERLAKLQRRIDDLPPVSEGTVRQRPVGGRTTTVTPSVRERDRFPTSLTDWVPVGIRVAFLQEIRVDATDVLGWGELWTPALRFDRDWRRAMIRMELPAPGRIPGVLHFEALTEQQLFEGSSLGSLRTEHRTRAGAFVSDWATSWLRWEVGPAFDRINETNYMNLEGQIGLRGFTDHTALIVTHARWLGSEDSFTRSEIVAAARSTTRPNRRVLSGMIGVVDTTGPAPLTVLPQAGSGQGQGILLRAHRADRRGLSGEEVLGRRMWFGTAEYEYPVMTRFGAVGLAGFADTVQAIARLDSRNSPLHVDVGAGVRFSPSASGTRVRLDFAYGLRDGRFRISAGYMLPWGVR